MKAGCIAYKIAAHAGDIARGIAGARQWDDDLSRARAALNWPRQFELAFDGETARALHDEDLEVDTDFCAMCGHDWCSMRISKEIVDFASGKDPAFQPERRAMRSPGVERRGPRAARASARHAAGGRRQARLPQRPGGGGNLGAPHSGRTRLARHAATSTAVEARPTLPAHAGPASYSGCRGAFTRV